LPINQGYFLKGLVTLSQTKNNEVQLRIALTKKRAGFRRGIRVFIQREGLRHFPWREPGRNPYEVLIAELLLKRTTSTAAARLYKKFLSKKFLSQYPNIKKLARAHTRSLSGLFKNIGLQEQRARAAKALAKYLISERGGRVPSGLEELQRIPGVGDYTARALLSVAFGIPTAVVDSNVERNFL